MKRVFLHSKKVIGNHWFIICIAGAISFVFAIVLFIILLVWSMAFTQDPVDVNDVMNNFTERELEIVLAENVDESVTDDEYLSTLARYQSYFCPKKVDYITTWVGSDYTGEAYILNYEVKRGYETVNQDELKDNILSSLNKNSVHAIRIARSHKKMIFRYTDRKTQESFEVVINHAELMAA